MVLFSLVRRTWPFFVAVVVPSAVVGVMLARSNPPDQFEIADPPVSEASASSGVQPLGSAPSVGEPTTIEVVSGAPVPRSAVRVLLIGTAASALSPQLIELDYGQVSADASGAAVQFVPGVYYQNGFEVAAAQVADDLGLDEPTAPIGDDGVADARFAEVDVVVVLG
jgi:hypothetical protein